MVIKKERAFLIAVKVRVLVIKEMPLEEKYDKLLDSWIVNVLGSYVLIKELGAADKGMDLSVKVSKTMFPRRIGIAFDLLKTITPGTAFNQLVEKYAYSLQETLSLQDFELNKVSDREATIRINNCPVLKRVRNLVEKTGLDIEPTIFCELESKINQGVAEKFGVNMVTELKENGCMTIAKLRIPMIIL